jgi:two-component system chemotaxis response regulator CheY
MKVLVIDDSENIRQEIQRALSSEGFEIIEAANGLEGVATLRARQDLALALCDINMPGMTGLELLAQVAQEGCKTPIVMLTSEGQPSLIARAKELGAQGWILKPFRVEFLVAAVRRLTSKTS